MATASELPIDTSASAMDMANEMFGNGITVQSATYTGADAASGIYSNGDSVAPGVTPSDTGVILSTGNAKSITNASGDANTSTGTSTDHEFAGDSDLDAVSGQTTYDAAVFESTFVPEGSTLTMQFTFSSEEYLEFVDGGYNDAMAVFVNGVPAELTFGDGMVTIDNINDESNSNLYLDNAATDDNYNTEMDGMTVTLTLKAPVNPNVPNTIKIAIADGGDGALDSNLMIAGNSVQTALVAEDDEFDIFADASKEFDLLENDHSAPGTTMSITAINGQPVNVGDTIMLNSGESVTVTETGLLLVEADDDVGSNVISYEVTDSDGNTDVAYVTINTVAPCFTAGTLIRTAQGERAIETLQCGDLVWTKDHGLQPLRWIGKAVRRAQGKNAPIRLRAGVLSCARTVLVSPNHRILIRSPQAELLFGGGELLVAAKFLVNNRQITRVTDGRLVTYVHVLFDGHEIVETSGLLSESFHPEAMGCDALDEGQRTELAEMFPHLGAQGGGQYGPTARPTLRKYEAQLLLEMQKTARPGRRGLSLAL